MKKLLYILFGLVVALPLAVNAQTNGDDPEPIAASVEEGDTGGEPIGVNAMTGEPIMEGDVISGNTQVMLNDGTIITTNDPASEFTIEGGEITFTSGMGSFVGGDALYTVNTKTASIEVEEGSSFSFAVSEGGETAVTLGEGSLTLAGTDEDGASVELTEPGTMTGIFGEGEEPMEPTEAPQAMQNMLAKGPSSKSKGLKLGIFKQMMRALTDTREVVESIDVAFGGCGNGTHQNNSHGTHMAAINSSPNSRHNRCNYSSGTH